MTDLDPVDLELLTGFTAKIDPLMRGVLVSGDVERIRGFVLEAAWNCTERPCFEHLWGVGGLHRAWMEIDDILDGRPVDYGTDTDAPATREFGLAAQEWLDMPRTETGFRDYVHRWERRWRRTPGPHPEERSRRLLLRSGGLRRTAADLVLRTDPAQRRSPVRCTARRCCTCSPRR